MKLLAILATVACAAAQPTVTVTGAATLDIFEFAAPAYTLSATPVPGTLTMVWLNGLLMAPGVDYTLSGRVVTWMAQIILPDATPIVQVMYWAATPAGTAVLLASTSAGGVGFWSTATTAPINTVGATLLVAAVADVTSSSWALSDSLGNTWVELPPYSAQSADVAIWYAWQGTGGPLATGADSVSFFGHLPAVTFLAFSGTPTGADPLDQQTGGAGGTGYGQSPGAGSITPTAAGELIITGVASWQASAFAASGFTIAGSMPWEETGTAYNEGVGAAYTVQPVAAPINPTWQLAASGYGVAAVAAFR